MDRDLVYVLLWLDEGEQRCAVYDDRELAEHDAALVRGEVVERPVFAAERERSGRFAR